RLHDVAQDVIINSEDCGTLRGIEFEPLKKNEEIVETLGERVLGRITIDDVVNPLTNEVIVKAGEMITEADAAKINASPLERIEVRSALTCEAETGICTKCYGRNLATNRIALLGEGEGVLASQFIGERVSQLTLRTFHVGGTAGNIYEVSTITTKFKGRLEIEDLKV